MALQCTAPSKMRRARSASRSGPSRLVPVLWATAKPGPKVEHSIACLVARARRVRYRDDKTNGSGSPPESLPTSRGRVRRVEPTSVRGPRRAPDLCSGGRPSTAVPARTTTPASISFLPVEPTVLLGRQPDLSQPLTEMAPAGRSGAAAPGIDLTPARGERALPSRRLRSVRVSSRSPRLRSVVVKRTLTDREANPVGNRATGCCTIPSSQPALEIGLTLMVGRFPRSARCTPVKR